MALTQISTQGIKDGTITGTDLATNVDLVDNQKLRLGNSQDLQIYHDGSNSYVNNTGTGLLILQGNGSQAVSIRGVDGETGIAVEPNGAVKLFHDNVKQIQTTANGVGFVNNCTFSDNKKIQIGDGNDLQIFHDGTDSIISHQGATGGDLIIQTTGSDDDVFIKCNDDFIVNVQNGNENAIIARNSGAVELFHNASKKLETSSTGVDVNGQLKISVGGTLKMFSLGTGNGFNFQDNVKAEFGNSGDLKIFHDGSQNIINGATGQNLEIQTNHFRVRNQADSESMIVANADSAVELYHNNSKKLETSSSGVTINAGARFVGPAGQKECTWSNSTGILNIQDNGKATFGTSSDLQIFHDGSFNKIQGSSAGNHLILRPNDSDEGIFIKNNDAVEIFFDGSKKFETTSGGVQVTDNLNMSGGHIFVADNFKLNLGTGDDLQLFHDGSESYVKNANAGSNLILESAHGVDIKHGGENMAKFKPDAAVELYHNNSKKFETTSTGVTVSSSGDPILTVTGSGHAKLNLTSTSGTDHCGVNFGDSSDENAGMIQYTNSINAMQFHANGSERMRILSDGAVCINATARPVVGTEFLGVQGGSASSSVGIAATVSHNEGIPFFASNSSNSFADRLMRFAAGSGGDVRGTIIFNGSAMVYGGTSDYRLKENITQITNGITKLKTLNPINFNWIKDETNTSIMGFLAHEVQEVMPEAVAGKKDAVDSKGEEDYQEMDYGRISPLIVAALQELVTKVEVLETEVASLKAS